MKKDYIFTPALAIISLLLSLLSLTGIIAHIVISIIGAIVLVAYSILCKGDWKIPALEIATRASYGIALITGIIIWKVAGLVALEIIHKIFSTLFAVGLLGLFIHKLILWRKG